MTEDQVLKKIRKILEERGLSQSDVGSHVGLTQSQISRILRKDRAMKLELHFPPEFVQRMVGHMSVTTTEVYLKKQQPRDELKAVEMLDLIIL